jgi:YD repeat-containing protein
MMRRLTVTGAALLATFGPALADGLLVPPHLVTAASAQTTFRDASGRITGYVSTDSNGTRTFRDGSGRITGTATTDANGTTTFRDGAGRVTGTHAGARRMGR